MLKVVVGVFSTVMLFALPASAGSVDPKCLPNGKGGENCFGGTHTPANIGGQVSEWAARAGKDSVSAPGSVGNWQLLKGPPVAKLCGIGAAASWNCFNNGPDNFSAPGAARAGGVPSWVLDLRMAVGSLKDTASIQAPHHPHRGLRPHSASISVPEGEGIELPLLLSGLVGLWLWSRKLLQRTPAA